MGRAKRGRPQCRRRKRQMVHFLSVDSLQGGTTFTYRCMMITGDPRGFMEKITRGMHQWIQWATWLVSYLGSEIPYKREPLAGRHFKVANGAWNSRVAVGWLHLVAPSVRVRQNRFQIQGQGAKVKLAEGTWRVADSTNQVPASQTETIWNFSGTKCSGLLGLSTTCHKSPAGFLRLINMDLGSVCPFHQWQQRHALKWGFFFF